jgi:hypothetical protein
MAGMHLDLTIISVIAYSIRGVKKQKSLICGIMNVEVTPKNFVRQSSI